MQKSEFYGPLERVNDFCWRIPKTYKEGMRVHGLIFADDAMIELIRKDQAPEQVANVAFLPGIQHASLAMPDIHWGYGFCIGGVAATDPDEGGGIQCGTLGSGNHFLEVQIVDRVFDEKAAQVMGLEKDMVCVMIHSGSRGLGYQVCDDSLRTLRSAPAKYGIRLPDQQLVCAPIGSQEGEHYLGAMCAAANFAWCNRQLLMWQAREAFEKVFGRGWEHMQMDLIYDVAHNIA